MWYWMSGRTRKYRIRNECIREKVGVTPIEKKIVESCLRWFRHVQRRLIEAPLRRVDQVEDSGTIFRDTEIEEGQENP